MGKCTQKKCLFQKGKPDERMCPMCDECGSEPHDINDNCVSCWNCMKDEGFIRSGKKKGLQQDVRKIIIIKDER